jgi:excisionase family DNA binding protein
MRIGTVRDAAAQLGITIDAVQRHAKAGEMPTLRRIGNRYRFDLDALSGWTPPPAKPRPKRRARLGADGNWILTHAAIDRLPDTGWVYFIQAEGGGPVKIGKADDVDERLRALQFSCPYRLVVLGKLPGGRRLEARLHKQFSACRLHGEWFAADTPGLADVIRKAAR